MSRLNDPNIVRVLGVCSQGEPLCVVVEYMHYGDLHQYLRRHVYEGATLGRMKHSETLRYVRVLDWLKRVTIEGDTSIIIDIEYFGKLK